MHRIVTLGSVVLATVLIAWPPSSHTSGNNGYVQLPSAPGAIFTPMGHVRITTNGKYGFRARRPHTILPKTGKTPPIRIDYTSVGAQHCCAAVDKPILDGSRKSIMRKIQLACDHNDANELRNLIKELRSKKGAMKRDEYRRAISAAAQLNMIEMVEDLLINARQDGRETTHLHNAAITGFGKAENWEKALEVLRTMPIEKDVVSFNAALSACQHNKAWHKIPSLLGDMARVGVRRNTITYNIMIRERARSKGLESALEVLNEMDEVGVRKDVYTFTNAISACVHSGSWNTAFNLLRLMRQSGIRPTNAPYSAAIAVCEKAKVWEPALQVLKEMHALDLNPSEITLSAAISAFRHQPGLVNAIKTFQFMKVKGKRTNTKTYGSLMAAYASTGAYEESLALMDEMEMSDAKLNSRILNLALEACVNAKQVLVALNTLMEARNKGQEFDDISYQICLRGCRMEGPSFLNTAEELLRQMEGEPFGITTRAYNMYLGLLVEVDPERALGLFENMSDIALKPDTYSYNTAINACGRSGRWEKAIEFLKSMKSDGLAMNVNTYTSAISACSQEAPDEALGLLREMQIEGVKPNAVTFSAALKACTSKRDWASALGLLADMSVAEVPKDLVVYTQALEAVKASGMDELALELYQEANRHIQEKSKNGGELPGFKHFRAKNIDLRQRNWKTTWKNLQSIQVEPEGRFTERFSRPAEYISVDEVSKVDNVMKPANTDEILASLANSGMVNILPSSDKEEDIENLDAEWDELENVDVGDNEWETVDPMSIPEIASRLRKESETKDNGES